MKIIETYSRYFETAVGKLTYLVKSPVYSFNFAGSDHEIFFGEWWRKGQVENQLEEKEVLEIITDRLDENSVFFDIGGHLGIYSVVCQDETNCQTYYFEPNKDVSEYAEKSFELNDVDVEICSLALANSNGSASVDGMSLDFSGNDIQVSRLDDLEIPSPDVVKIDVEGMELEVLKGGVRNKFSKAELIAVELHLESVQGFGLSEDEYNHFREILESKDFELNETRLRDQLYLFAENN